MSRQDEIQKLLKKHNRRLQKLKEQKAVQGFNTPAEILNDIEDIEAEVEFLQEELKNLHKQSPRITSFDPFTRLEDSTGEIKKNDAPTSKSSKSSWLYPTGFILVGLLLVCVLAVCVSPAIGFGSILSGNSFSPQTNVATATSQEPIEFDGNSREVVPTPIGSTPTPGSTATSSPEIVMSPIATAISFEANQTEISKNFNDVTVAVTQIELLPDDRMRWHFLFDNQSDSDLKLRLDYRLTYLADEFGNQYSMLRDQANSNPDYIFESEFQSKVKRNHWIEFSSLKDGAKEFTVVLEDGTTHGDFVGFSTFVVKLLYDADVVPTVPTSPTPTGSTVLPVNQTEISKNFNDVTVTVTEIELLPDDRMRWHFLFDNQSDSDLKFRLDYRRTYLADEFGNKYSMLRDKANSDPDYIFESEFQSKVKRNHWIEFPSPEDGAKEFTVVLEDGTTHGDFVDFSTFAVKLPE